jgi:hypothetical protein
MRRHSRSEQDQQDARQFAGLMCAHPDAIDAFLAYCCREAALLLTEHAAIVQALAEALLKAETLTGAQIDVVIGNALVRADQAAERRRRAAIVKMVERARAFAAYTEEEPDG